MKHAICILLALLLCPAAMAEEDHCYDALGLSGEENMWPVRREGLYGFVDQTGNLIIPCEWEAAGMVVDGRAPVMKNGRWGVIDREGNLVVPCEWDSLLVDSYGGYIMHKNGYCGAMALDGSVLIPCDRYTYVGPAVDGVRHICRDDAWGMCTTTGEIITDCQWNNPGYFHDGLAFVSDMSGRNYGYINEQGELMIPLTLSHADDFHDGAAVVRFTDGTWQLIDPSGRNLCDQAWDDMEQFSTGALIMVEKDGKFGYVNRRGEVAIPLIYDRAQEFGDGLALVRLGEDTFWIDENGERALDRPEGYTSFAFSNGFAAIRDKNGLNGLMDRQGSIVIPCRWETMLRYTFAADELAVAMEGGRNAFLNKQGDIITGKMYEQDAVQYGIAGSTLFLLENGVLSIWSASGEKLY